MSETQLLNDEIVDTLNQCIYMFENWLFPLTHLNITMASSNELFWSSNLQTAMVENSNTGLSYLKINLLNIYGQFKIHYVFFR